MRLSKVSSMFVLVCLIGFMAVPAVGQVHSITFKTTANTRFL